MLCWGLLALLAEADRKHWEDSSPPLDSTQRSSEALTTLPPKGRKEGEGFVRVARAPTQFASDDLIGPRRSRSRRYLPISSPLPLPAHKPSWPVVPPRPPRLAGPWPLHAVER